ncbi:MAG TPA: sigma-70 family RNA polymerase sigma factor [Planctomycetota bacterium]|nr:sigma-70 family RNA polymerase sigma factor [Planctomycetota bacterium]
MSSPFADQLQHHAKALRRLARDLVGEQHADDLLQDAAVQALVAPPQKPGPLGGWFAAVLRHLASKHRRGEQRRRRREQTVARPEALPAADVEVTARDEFQRLGDAVLALPQPYQGVLLRRYLREQAPGAIAAATGVPLATVKSQLQRGLTMLRERFERDGGNWRGGLLAAFALRPAATAAGVGTGALIMAGAGKLLGVAAAAVLALAAAWWLRGDEPAGPGAVTAATPSLPLAGAAGAGGQPSDAGSGAAAQRTALPEPRPAPATLRGRCVDAAGAPLAGCRVTLDGRADIDGDLEYWVRHHYDPQWENPPAAHTGADGRFEFGFVPHEPLRFSVRMAIDGLVAMTARWPARTSGKGIAPGEDIDLGDVVLGPGMLARGRVADDTGAPVAGVRVSLQRRQRAAESASPQPAESDSLRTDDSGTFAAAPLPTGQYLVSVDHAENYLGGAPVAHDLLEPAPWLELRLQRQEPPPSVQGVVVDEQGRPIANASVHSPGIRRGAWSRDDGTFELFASPDDPTPGSLRINQEGFETRILPGPFAWGSRGLRVVMRSGLDVELQVVDAEGRPVEDFAAWIWLDYDDTSGPRPFLPGDQHARTYGHHAGGRVTLHGLRRGRHRLFVEPRDEALMATSIQRIELTDPSPVLRVSLPAIAERIVRVVDGEGAAVEGTTVALLEQAQGELDAAADVWPIEVLLRTFKGSKALMRQQASTDVRGEAVLRGPADGRFAVRVPGPYNLPAFVGDVRLDVAAPLSITVQRGGALQVELRPAGVVAALRRYAGLGEAVVPPWEPRLQLWRPNAAGGDAPEVQESVLTDTGRATLAGVPSGTWHLRLAACVRTSPLMASHWRLELGDYALRDGKTTAAVLDLPQLLPAELRCTVMHNGAPLARAAVRLRGVFAPEDSDYAARYGPWNIGVTTDETGSFTATVRPGRYTVVATNPFKIAADEVIRIGPGDHAVQTFTMRSGQLRVHYVDADGKPVQEVDAVLVDNEHNDEAFRLAFSDATGMSTTQVEPRTFALFAQRSAADEQPPERLPLGTVTVQQGTLTAVGRTLPASWLRR